MYEIVRKLKDSGVKVGLFTNIEKRYAKVAQQFGLFELFDPCILTCNLGIRKPHLKAYEELLKAVDQPASEIIFVDDNHENIEAARKMGLDAIQFESSRQIQGELRKRGFLN